jgi:carboxypeptidase C (cathepsin A)
MPDSYAVLQSADLAGRAGKFEFRLDFYPVRDSAGVEIGSASVFSYLLESDDPMPSARPVIFAFNGGPGASSAFLHLGGLGPVQVGIPEDPSAGIHPPYPLQQSTHSLLDTADLVFIDPVGAGFGRFAGGADPTACYSVLGDARYFADIIRGWVRRNGRWDSPKYILGESYGTQRAPFLAAALLDGPAVPLDGIILLGQALNVQETLDRPGNVTAAIASLPLKAAVAWYHRVGSPDCATAEDAVEAALEYAHTDFALAMLKGRGLSESERTEVAARLESMTGISANRYLRTGLWLSKSEFRRELLGDRGLVLGRDDARYVSRAPNTAAGENETDPAGLHIWPAYTAGVGRQFHEVLGVPAEDEYRLVDTDASARWDWADPASARFLQMGRPSPFTVYPYPSRLTQYFKYVPTARLFIGTGIYDTLTTIGAAEHLLRQYDLPDGQVTSRRYPAGHMMYTDPVAAAQLSRDLRAFVTVTSAQS